MPPAMKVIMKWEDDADPNRTTSLKISLPRKWKEGPISNLKNAFVEHFNKKHPGAPLKEDEVHLENEHGDKFADLDIVIRVAKTGEHLAVKQGAAPTDLFAPFEVAQTEESTTAAKTTPASKNTHVASKAALQAAMEPPKLSFDYSKWDRLDLSDDDGDDCHPNIDKESWKRLKARQREDRREKEEEKLEKLTKKIEKHEKRAKEVRAQIDAGNDDPQLLVDLKDAESNATRYREKKEDFLAKRKLVADDLCEVKEDSSKLADVEPVDILPAKPVDVAESYDAYVKEHQEMLMKFSTFTNDTVSHEFIMQNQVLLSEHAEGFLLLLCLDACMRHQQSTDVKTVKVQEAENHEEYRISKQHLLIHYILELAKGMKREPIEAVNPFFRKVSTRSPEQIKGFDDDLKSFVEKIRKRASDKIANNELSPLADVEEEQFEDEYEPAGLGPGGLDPNEVLNSLPSELADAFVEQDTPKLKRVLMSLPPEEAEYHMKRCVDSGLWVANANE